MSFIPTADDAALAAEEADDAAAVAAAAAEAVALGITQNMGVSVRSEVNLLVTL